MTLTCVLLFQVLAHLVELGELAFDSVAQLLVCFEKICIALWVKHDRRGDKISKIFSNKNTCQLTEKRASCFLSNKSDLY